jgi:hypothetical protein
MTGGLTPDEAHVKAVREFGGVSQFQEECRDKRRTQRVEEFAGDVRYAVRLFAKSPGFTAVALLSLALGIGANTAIFTLLETVILRELPVREPGALVQIGSRPWREGSQGSFSDGGFNARMFANTWNSQD